MSGCGYASVVKTPSMLLNSCPGMAGVHPRQVSYAGMKDRRAVTEQWFSVQLPGREEPDWQALNSATLTVLRHAAALAQAAAWSAEGQYLPYHLA